MGYLRKLSAIVIAIFFMVSINIYAQQRDEQQNTSTGTQTKVDTVAATQNVVIDSTSTNQFQKVAREMTLELLQKTTIGLDKADDIEKILVDYQKDIADAKSSANVNNSSGNNNNENNEMLGGNAQKLNEIDQEANSDIEGALTDDEKSNYMFVKEDWWKDVKSKVYGSEDQNQNDLNNQNKNDQENNQNQNPQQNSSDQGQSSDQNQNTGQNNQMQHDTAPDTGRTGHQSDMPADTSSHR